MFRTTAAAAPGVGVYVGAGFEEPPGLPVGMT